MPMLASFNYVHSDSAVMIGVCMGLGIALLLIGIGRPWLAAAVGAGSWAGIGYFVGNAGTGDMADLMGLIYALLAGPSGAIVVGTGAFIRRFFKRSSSARANAQDRS